MDKPEAKFRPHRRLYPILTIVVCILLAAIIFCAADSILAHTGNKPIFCISFSYQDGGTVGYYGLGYQIITWHSMARENETNGYLVGTEINYLLGMHSVSDGPGIELKFVT